MENHKTYHFLTGTLRACLKLQFKNWLILILKGFLGVISLTFIPSAIGAKKPNSQEIREALDGNISEPSHTPDLADMAVTSPVLPAETSTDSVLNVHEISTHLNNQSSAIITNGDQETKRGFPKESLNRVQDVMEDLTANETNEDVKYEMKSLWRELEEKILSDNLSIPKVIDLLRNEVTKKIVIPYRRRAVIYIMRELLKNYSFPDNLQVSQIIDSLKEVISIKFINSYAKEVAIHIMGELLIQYPLPKSEISQAFNQIKEHLFHENIYVRKTASQITENLLKTNKISEIKKQETIVWITDHLNDENDKTKAFALQILNNLVKLNIVSDPDDKKKIILKLRNKLTDPNNKEAQKAAVAHLISLINHKNNLLDSDDRKEITSELVELLTDPNWAIQTTTKEKTITNLHTLLSQQDTLLNSNDKKKIALILPQWLNDEKKRIQYAALIKLSEILLNQITLPHPNQIILSNSEGVEIPSIMELIHTIAMLIFDDKQTIRQGAGRMIESFWINDDFPLPEKLNIIQFLSENISTKTTGISTALNVLRQANKAGLPLDFDMIYEVTDMVSEPSALGETAENLVREYLNTPSLSDDPDTDARLRLTLHLELEEQLAKRSQLAQPDKAEITACQKSMLPSDNTQPDAS